MGRRRVKGLDTTVYVTWDSWSEKVAVKVDHGMLVLPENTSEPTDPSSSHRVFFSGKPVRQVQMVATVLGYALEAGIMPAVLRLLRDNPEMGENRGAGEPLPVCPSCGQVVAQ